MYDLLNKETKRFLQISACLFRTSEGEHVQRSLVGSPASELICSGAPVLLCLIRLPPLVAVDPQSLSDTYP